jgi:hypothetical protein
MSTKTNFKRVALVAVASLGLGVLTSVAPANAVSDLGASSLYIGATASNTGAAVTSFTRATNRQVGLVTVTSTTPTLANSGYTLTSSAVATGIVLAGAQLPFIATGAAATSTNGISVVVTGGTLSSVDMDSVADDGGVITDQHTLTVSGARTSAVVVQTGTTAAALAGIFTVSGAAGSTVTLTAYQGTGVRSTTPTNGTPMGSWSFTVAAASASAVYSPTYSVIAQQIAATKSTTVSGAEIWDNTTRIGNGGVGVIAFSLKDAYGAALTTGAGTLAVTATNSAGVLISDTVAGALPYSATTAFHSLAMPSDGAGWIIVNQPVANTAGSSTLTITLNGEVLATKTFNWAGDIASITVDTENSNNIFRNGAAVGTYTEGNGGVIYVVKDAAGNVLDVASQVAISGATGALINASVSSATSTTYGTVQSAAVGYGYTTMLIPSSDLYGAGTYKLKLTNAVGTTIYSPVINATVSKGALNSFVASWDKATYAPGDIAVLTITGKDIYGNTISDAHVPAGLTVTVAGSTTVGFNSIGTACTDAAQAFYGGKFTCKFAANTEGAWSYNVDMTTVTVQSASVGSLKITSGGGVTNADVLKAIVSLIASINKQIAALQKALLKK